MGRREDWKDVAGEIRWLRKDMGSPQVPDNEGARL